MNIASRRKAVEVRVPSGDPLLRFARGEIDRTRAMSLLGDIGYGELLDRLAARGLTPPELPSDEVERMAQDVVRLLDLAER